MQRLPFECIMYIYTSQFFGFNIGKLGPFFNVEFLTTTKDHHHLKLEI
jgi:hypothetical protein